MAVWRDGSRETAPKSEKRVARGDTVAHVQTCMGESSAGSLKSFIRKNSQQCVRDVRAAAHHPGGGPGAHGAPRGV
eukprot:3284359-Prymnesium_polylepis.2